MTLFDPETNEPGKARRDHPGTSKAAAVAVIPRTGTARWKVLQAIADLPRTDEQIQDMLSMPANTERPRRVELVEKGWIEPHPSRTGKTKAGQPCIVWRLTEDGATRLGNIEIEPVKVQGHRL